MERHRLSSTELIATAGGLLLLISLFLPWYGTDSANRFANIDGERGTFSCWDVHPILRWLLLLAALAPFILAYIIVRGHQLSWARGELTAVVAIAALGLLLFNAFGGPAGRAVERHQPRVGLVRRPARHPAHALRLGQAVVGDRARPQAPGGHLSRWTAAVPTATSPSSSSA